MNNIQAKTVIEKPCENNERVKTAFDTGIRTND